MYGNISRMPQRVQVSVPENAVAPSGRRQVGEEQAALAAEDE